jgi:hypothetical protein
MNDVSTVRGVGESGTIRVKSRESLHPSSRGLLQSKTSKSPDRDRMVTDSFPVNGGILLRRLSDRTGYILQMVLTVWPRQPSPIASSHQIPLALTTTPINDDEPWPRRSTAKAKQGSRISSFAPISPVADRARRFAPGAVPISQAIVSMKRPLKCGRSFSGQYCII